MKKTFFFHIRNILSFALIIISILSCKNTTETKLVYTENNTIKQSVKNKEQIITWTLEMEEGRLTESISRNSIQIGMEVPYSKEIYKLPDFKKKPVYPSINEFGSLDVTDLKPVVRERLNQFIKSFISDKHENAENYFSRKYLFNYIFFLNDFESGWEKNFGKELPDAPDLFTRWIFGQPFNGNDIIQIPVRFYTNCGTIDMTVFMNSKGNNEFYQITIDRWLKG